MEVDNNTASRDELRCESLQTTAGGGGGGGGEVKTAIDYLGAHRFKVFRVVDAGGSVKVS